MFRYFETIRIENGIPMNVKYHQERLLRTLTNNNHLTNKGITVLQLEELLKNIPDYAVAGIFKCRIQYMLPYTDNADISYQITFEPYEQRQIHRLKIVVDDIIEYPFKYTDRTPLDALVGLKGDCDDILIIKNGCVTDTSIANIIFYDGKEWFTPANPLLAGTTRARLLDAGIIREEHINLADLHRFISFKLINSMIDDNLSQFEDLSCIIY